MASSQPDVEQLAADDRRGPTRPRWSSRAAFLFAAIGSAVGLGNIWRFPYLCFKFGGASFLLPYFLALVLVGHPILMLELGLGQLFQSGDIGAFGGIHKRLRGIGLASVFGVFVIVCYYSVVLSWCCQYIVVACGELPFRAPEAAIATGLLANTTNTTAPAALTAAAAPAALMSTASFFNDHVLQLHTSDDANFMFRPAEAQTYNPPLIYGLLFIWLAIYLCTFKGVVSASKVVYVTMPVPIVLLLVLLVQGQTLEGSSVGISKYLFETDTSYWQRSDTWGAALGQVFFSLSVCMGVMTAYSSYNGVNQHVVADNHIIALGDTLTSFLGGFVIYSVLGYMAVLRGSMEAPDEDVFNNNNSGPGLAFVAYPEALSTLPGRNAWIGVFFTCLLLLGIDSAFSMVEAVATVVKDRFTDCPTRTITAVLCLIGFTISTTVFAASTGLYWLDLCDFYVNQFGMVLIGFLETAAAGWCYALDTQYHEVGRAATLWYNGSCLLIVVVAVAVGLSLHNTLGAGGAYLTLGGACALWVAVWRVGLAKAAFHRREAGLPACAVLPLTWELCGWHGPEKIRIAIDSMSGYSNHTDAWWMGWVHPGRITPLWGFWIKYLIPPVLLLMLGAQIRDVATTPYGGYPPWAQAVGVVIVLIMLVMVLMPAIEPALLADKQPVDFAAMYPPVNPNIRQRQFSAVPTHDVLDGALRPS